MEMKNQTLLEKLKAKGPKRILALDGGGIRGAITLGFLEKMEKIIRDRHDDQSLRLCDYFDLIGGTSTGGIIASSLAIGMTASEIKEMYLKLGGEIFGKKRKPFAPIRALLRANYDHGPLESELRNIFGDIAIGDQEKLKTGLMITAKRADTFSTWTLINHPEGKYYEYNKHIKLIDALRATSAAPTFFLPKLFDVGGGQVAAFVDGGVSLANNPSMLLFLAATLNGYPFNWQMGEDKLQIISVGTGISKKKIDVPDVPKMGPLDWAKKLPDLFMEDAQYFNQLLLQMMSDSPTAREIDGMVGDLKGDLFFGKKILSYQRYNVVMDNRSQKEIDKGEKTYKLDEYGFNFDAKKVAHLQEMDKAENRFDLAKIGEAASVEVKDEHFLPAFNLGDKKEDVLTFGTFEKPQMEFNKAVKKPVPVEAKQMDKPFRVESLEGTVEGRVGDYLMRGIDGELYVCAKEIFEKSYDVQA